MFSKQTGRGFMIIAYMLVALALIGLVTIGYLIFKWIF